MRVSKIVLKDFKRFDDLTIDLGDQPAKIIAIVGPNGSGKSSVFDAFEEMAKQHKGTNSAMPASYFSKAAFSEEPEKRAEAYERMRAIAIFKPDGTSTFGKKSFYMRTAYRFTASLQVEEVRAQPDMVDDQSRPTSSSALDIRLAQNYPRLLGSIIEEVLGRRDKTGAEIIAEYMGRINDVLERVLEIKIHDVGNVAAGRGQLYFEKGTSKGFPYENLSSGEKEVVDLVMDLVIKVPEFNETVFCIDEPELHLNTAIQRKLLVELEKLIPENCQLWVATHSVGFLRALQEELRDKSQILDFSERDYFNGAQNMVPMRPTRRNWQRVFETALEDLTGLVAPKMVVYCEGTPRPTATGDEAGLDATVYNEIFQEEFHDVLFVSSGGNDAEKHAELALKVIGKAFDGVALLLLKDRDGISDAERADFLAVSPERRMLVRREIENYLYDPEVLGAHAISVGNTFDRTTYETLVTDPTQQDFKAPGSDLQERIKNLCRFRGSLADFKKTLAKHVSPDSAIYSELRLEILGV